LTDENETEDDGADPRDEPISEIDNAGDVAAIKRKRDRTRRDKDEAAEFWKAVLSTPIGRREVWAILRSAHTFEERFACGPNGFPQPEATWFEAGQQAWGMRFYHSLALIDRDAVFVMHDEHDPRFAKPSKRK
jgi:hypothetical protein